MEKSADPSDAIAGFGEFAWAYVPLRQFHVSKVDEAGLDDI